jgi:fused signal recognition particle receptor
MEKLGSCLIVIVLDQPIILINILQKFIIMFKWLKKNKSPSAAETTLSASGTPLESEEVAAIEEVVVIEPVVLEVVAAEQPVPEQPKSGLFKALRVGLKRTRTQFGEGLANLVLGKKKIDEGLLGQLKTQLLLADVGVAATERLIADMTARVKRSELADADSLFHAIQQALLAVLSPCQLPWVIPADKKPYVILMIGVNGTGKTTTIGKLAKRLQQQGKSVLLAAGDTFRAAAVEQLKVWGERNNIPVIAQHNGADSASVVFDALSAARARNIDVLIVDTAGRLHTQSHLMDELKKIKRVMSKLDPTAPHETMLVLDAGIGQNALRQAEQFHQALVLDSITVTKLDGTAKGGTIFSLAANLHLPIRFIGVGEGIDDLQPFDAETFVKALFDALPAENGE